MNNFVIRDICPHACDSDTAGRAEALDSVVACLAIPPAARTPSVTRLRISSASGMPDCSSTEPARSGGNSIGRASQWPTAALWPNSLSLRFHALPRKQAVRPCQDGGLCSHGDAATDSERYHWCFGANAAADARKAWALAWRSRYLRGISCSGWYLMSVSILHNLGSC